MRLQWINSFPGLAPYRDAWENILAENRNQNPYVTPDWLAAWWRFFGQGWDLRVLTLFDGELPVGFLPLMYRKGKIGWDARFVGYPRSGRMDFVVRRGYEREFARRTAHELASASGTVVYTLHGFRRGDPCYEYFIQALGGRPLAARTLPSTVIRLSPGGFGDFMSRRQGHKSIKITIKRETQLDKLIGLRFEKAGPGELDAVFSLHERRWEKKNDENGFGRGRAREFFTWLAQEQRSRAWNVHVYLLKAGQLPIAFSYGIECNGRFTFYRVAHDDTFALYKPGMITVKKTIGECFRSGYSFFDFATGDEPYKRSWSDELEWIDRITFGTSAPAAAAAIRIEQAKTALRKHLRRNKALAYMKRVTAGRVKYALTGRPAADWMRHTVKTIRQRKISGFLICTLKKWFPPRKAFVRAANPAQWHGTGGSVAMREAPLDEVHALSALTGMDGGMIAERYSRGGRCVVLSRENRPVGRAWIRETKMTEKGKILWEPVRPGDRCVFDLCMFDRRGGTIRDSLLRLLSDPLPRRGNTVTLLLRTWDAKLRREAAGLFRPPDCNPPRR